MDDCHWLFFHRKDTRLAAIGSLLWLTGKRLLGRSSLSQLRRHPAHVLCNFHSTCSYMCKLYKLCIFWSFLIIRNYDHYFRHQSSTCALCYILTKPRCYTWRRFAFSDPYFWFNHCLYSMHEVVCMCTPASHCLHRTEEFVSYLCCLNSCDSVFIQAKKVQFNCLPNYFNSFYITLITSLLLSTRAVKKSFSV